MAGQKTCLIIGAGAGIGGTVGKKFAQEGYHAALCRRSDIDGLNGMVEGLQSSGLSASGHLLNAVDEGALESLIEEVEAIGPIDTVLYNLGAQIGNRSLDDTPLKTFEWVGAWPALAYFVWPKCWCRSWWSGGKGPFW